MLSWSTLSLHHRTRIAFHFICFSFLSLSATAMDRRGDGVKMDISLEDIAKDLAASDAAEASASPSSSGAPPPKPNWKRRNEEVQANYKNRNAKSSEAYNMKTMFLHGAGIRSGTSQKEQMNMNPIWMDFPTKCAQKVSSADEMRRLLNFHTQSDEVFLVRYHQDGCTACNAVEKAYEFMCHDSKRFFPKLTYYEVSKDECPELTKGMVRFPQVKGFAGGQWHDVDFKPPSEFREKLLRDVENEVQRMANNGIAVTAVQAEEMYFSGAGPAMLLILEESIYEFYTKSQTRLHNYWKQVSVRRSWFYKKHIEPHVNTEVVESAKLKPVFGDKIIFGPDAAPNPNDA